MDLRLKVGGSCRRGLAAGKGEHGNEDVEMTVAAAALAGCLHSLALRPPRPALLISASEEVALPIFQ